MKKVRKAVCVVLLIVLCGFILMCLNPSLNYFELKGIEKKALGYIQDTYPGTEVEEISVSRGWRSNYYTVYYSDPNGKYVLVYDHTGELAFWNEYLEEKVSAILEKKVDIMPKVHVYAESRLYDKDRTRELVLEGPEKEPITCAFTIISASADENVQIEGLAKTAKDIYLAVYDEELPIDDWKISQINSVPMNAFEIQCPDNMHTLSTEEIKKLVIKQ